MVETDGGRPDAGVEPWVRDSLFALGGIYAPLGNGLWMYYGERPGAGWHGHGYCEKTLTMLVDGAPVRARLRKHRWPSPTSFAASAITGSSRSPGSLPSTTCPSDRNGTDRLDPSHRYR